MAKQNFGYRVVYGETMPAWERIFATKAKAQAFAQKQRDVGDVVFSVAPVVPGEAPKSMAGILQNAQ